MWSNAGMANRQGADTCAKRKSPPPVNTLAWLGLAWLGLAWLGLAWLGLAWLGLNPVILHTYTPMKMEQSFPKRRHTTLRRRGINHKKANNIQKRA
jgi:hypothetical protein